MDPAQGKGRNGTAGAAEGPASESVLPPGPGKGYLVAVLAGALATLLAFYLALGALKVTGHLPPPAFANTVCVDEKLRFMREQGELAPDLLAVGSSIAWRTFDAGALVDANVAKHPFNAGFCGLHTNQMAYVTHWLLDRHKTVEHVLLLTAPQDFAECTQKRTTVFDRGDAARYVDREASQWPFYLEYFSPVSLVRNARKIKQRRTDTVDIDPLIFDRFGAGPMDTTRSRPTLYYGPPAPLEEECFDALRSLAQRLEREGRQFTVVLTPIHPAWKAKEDPQGAFMQEFRSRLRAALAPTGAVFWDGDEEWTPDLAMFTDAIHLRWAGAKAFSRAVAAQLRKLELSHVEHAGATLAR